MISDSFLNPTGTAIVEAMFLPTQLHTNHNTNHRPLLHLLQAIGAPAQ